MDVTNALPKDIIIYNSFEALIANNESAGSPG